MCYRVNYFRVEIIARFHPIKQTSRRRKTNAFPLGTENEYNPVESNFRYFPTHYSNICIQSLISCKANPRVRVYSCCFVLLTHLLAFINNRNPTFTRSTSRDSFTQIRSLSVICYLHFIRF